MDVITSLAIVTFAAVIHASFQLSVSVLTLLSGHTIGAKKSRARLLSLTASFVTGTGVMTLLTFSFVSLIFLHLFGVAIPLLAWAIVCGLVFGIGIAVWLFYYRKNRPGTELWIPRAFATYLTRRSKATHHTAEAFGLGLSSVIAESIFILPCLTIAALALIGLPAEWQLLGVGVYAVVSLLGVLIVWVLVGGGTSLSTIQKWRERNKRFLQFSAGSALIVLGFFVYVTKIVATVSGAS
jgi:hypothetical protein